MVLNPQGLGESGEGPGRGRQGEREGPAEDSRHHLPEGLDGSLQGDLVRVVLGRVLLYVCGEERGGMGEERGRGKKYQPCMKN